MAKRTFATIWQQIEKLYQSHRDGKKSAADINKTINELLEKPDVENIIQELGLLLMMDYESFNEIDFKFELVGEDSRFWRPSFFDSKAKIIIVDPLKVLEFSDFIRDEEKLMVVDADFEKYRKNSLLAEVGKLPNKCLLFLSILQQIAISGGLTHIGLSEIPQGELTDTAYYQTLLWSFNELEKKLYTLNGINIRTEYNVTWHESEWITT
ncbi:MAG: hypothetical protein NE328_01645 [Lentisphaeraceae bacterium]|nr:hypothetical protein [Lentisphaeraceae bacterium]